MPDDAVATPSAAYELMKARWALPQTLMGGTQAMRAAGEDYLPREPMESQGGWENRRDRSFLFNLFKKTVQSMTGRVFQKEVTLGEDVPLQIGEWAENVDLSGRHLNVFGRELFESGAVPGIAHVLVDMQRNTPGSTLADERDAGLRPYFKLIHARDLIGWRAELINGAPTLTQIRIFEESVEPEGDFGEVGVQRVRVIERDNFRLFRKNEDAEWEVEDEGEMTLGEIPLATFYAQRTDFLMAEPPFDELAWLNAAHWQSASDQRHILHVARVPILFGKNLPEERESPQPIGPNILFEGDETSDLKFVEHGGSAIGAGRQDLVDLEERMRIMAAQPLLPRTGNVTATATAIDTSQTNSQLMTMAIGLNDAIEQAFGFMARWAKLGEEGGSVDVNKDFGVSAADAQDVQALVQLRIAGEISRETLWEEFKRRDILMDAFDPDVEAERLEAEGTQPQPEDDVPPLPDEGVSEAA